VWAPNAEAVAVLIQNGPYWELTEDGTLVRQELGRDGGYWSGTVAGVRARQLYRFEIRHRDAGVLHRLNPAARDVLSSDLTRADPSSRNASVVFEAEPLEWAPFRTPAFENVLIYQFHIGTFAGRADEFDKGWANLQDVEAKFGYIRELVSTAFSRCRCMSLPWTGHGGTTRRRSLRPSRPTDHPPLTIWRSLWMRRTGTGWR
jgi:1,4-alpha-glucan branching enzyme